MDVLVALGTTAPYVYSTMATFTGEPSYQLFEMLGMLICFVLLGKWMNVMAIYWTSKASMQWMKLQAKTASKVTLDKMDVKHLFSFLWFKLSFHQW
jgi:Cu+-exporting ATPase